MNWAKPDRGWVSGPGTLAVLPRSPQGIRGEAEIGGPGPGTRSLRRRALRNAALALALVLGVSAQPDAARARTVIQNKGSDSLAVAVQAWADAYRRVEPDIGIAVNAGGSGTGIAALLNGTADIANSSRQMTDGERATAREFGIEPVEHIVGHDAVAVVVHPDNPVASLTLAQLAAVFGRGGDIRRWPDLAVDVPGCQDQVVVRVGRQNSSGTYAYFRAVVLGKGKYRQGTLAMRGTLQVADLVAETRCAIGYASLAYVTPQVRTVCIAAQEGEDCAVPSAATDRDRRYALVRPLYMYTTARQSGPVRAYLDWITSDTGQCVIARHAYVPLRALHCGD